MRHISPFRRGGSAACILAALVSLASFPVLADDGIDLTVSYGPGRGEVLLRWTGGSLPFGVYRSIDPASVAEPANQLGQTDGGDWIDLPPLNDPLDYYLVTSMPPCPPGQTLCPAGCVDLSNDANNCGACGASCDDFNPCTNNLCTGSECRHVDYSRCVTTDPNNMDPGDTLRCGPSGCGVCSFAASLPGCSAPDTDGDGLNDTWESNQAIDLDCNGTYDANDVVIPDADPRVADVYVKASAMIGSPTELDPNGHVPSPEAIARMVAAFGGSHLSTAPVRCDATTPCPSGHTCSIADFVCLPDCVTDNHCVTGVCAGGLCRMRRLHFDHASINIIPHANVIFMGPVQTSCITGADPSQGVNFYDIKADPGNFDPRKALFTRFGVFGHFQSCDSTQTCADTACVGIDGLRPDHTSTGLAELSGNDWVVTLGAFPPPATPTTKALREAGSCLHELGHNLGLHHGGPHCDPATDPGCTWDPSRSRKVNYLSVMNHMYIFGIPVTDIPGSVIRSSDPARTRIDFSHAALMALDERALDEAQGVGPGQPPAYVTDLVRYFNPDVGPVIWFGSTLPGQPIDWNADGFPSDIVAVNINNDPPGAPPSEIHTGAEDWSYLKYPFQCGAIFLDGAGAPKRK